MDEMRLRNRVQFLAHELFVANKDGAEFLRLIKLAHMQLKTFPQPADFIASHGGALAWSAWRDGQAALMSSFTTLGQEYLQKLEAENKTKEQIL